MGGVIHKIIPITIYGTAYVIIHYLWVHAGAEFIGEKNDAGIMRKDGELREICMTFSMSLSSTTNFYFWLGKFFTSNLRMPWYVRPIYYTIIACLSLKE